MNPLAQSVTALPGVGSRRGAQLAKLGLFKVEDFLSYFPRDYEDRTGTVPVISAIDGQRACVRGVVSAVPTTALVRKNLSLTKFKVFDDTGVINMTFFNNPYIKSRVEVGREYVFFGTIEAKGGHKSMVNPVFETPEAGRVTGRIVPVYRLGQGISQKLIADSVAQAMRLAQGMWDEPLPPWVVEDYGLCGQEEAYCKIHFPATMEEVAEARRRLIFEELFVYCCASRGLKGKSDAVPGAPMENLGLEGFLARLPFGLTGAQRRAIDEIAAGMTGGVRMNRLLQGDVGSGKTVVAAAAAFLAMQNGYQAALMAPTELLAAQHYENLKGLFEDMGFACGLLTASVPAARKRQLKQQLADGEIQLLCGTHAVLQDDLAFKNAGIFVIDEQHRFGVRQRAALREKQPQAHLLVMSATPIPRTLTLIIYGDLEVSVLDELPPGRQKIQTFADGEARRQRIFRFLERQVKEEGGQAYIVCPLIEDEEGKSERTAATEYAQRLKNTLPGLKIGLLHGKLRPAEKDAVMAAFAAGETDVLVSTTVIEVGVDVPNATLMIVENADLFGLSQLHQLRGRVGRGRRQSYCILMSNNPGETARARLKTLCSTGDGFVIAEEDLRLRGPGDFFGSRQHGLPEFKIADLAGDTRVLYQALEAANRVFDEEGGLQAYPALEERVAQIISRADGGTLN